MNARSAITIIALAILAIGLAACSPAPQGVVDIGNPPDTSTITPQKATLAGLEIECPLGYTLTSGETEANCVGAEYSWYATAYDSTADDENDDEEPEAIVQKPILEEYPHAPIVTGMVDDDWIYARAELRLEIFTVYYSERDEKIVELHTRYADEGDRPEVTVTPRPRPR